MTESHEHEFEEPDVVEADEVLVIEQQCTHAPVLNEWVDDSRDEVYTETGDRCEAVRRTVFAIDEVRDVSQGEIEPLHPDGSQKDEMLWEDSVVIAEQTINQSSANPTRFDPDYQQITVGVDHRHGEFEVVYNRDHRTIEQ